MKKILLFCLFIYTTTQAQIVTIPDANFKNALLNSNCVDTNNDGFGEFDADINNDGEIQITEAEAITGLILFYENIDSLEGIESFINLELLNCNLNNLTNLDLSQNLNINRLNCGGNQLTNITVSQLENLETLKCHANLLNSIDVTQNQNLNYFNCSSNNLSELNVSQNNNLYWLICSENPSLNTIDVSQNIALGNLYCVNNNLTSLDVSNNSNLIGLRCEDNNLNALNLANNNNINMIRMFSFNNPNLTCIQVDDVNLNFSVCSYEDLFTGWCIDDFTNYSQSCNLSINDNTFNFTISPNPTQDVITINTNYLPQSIYIYSLQGAFIKKIDNSNKINISGLNAGIYFIKVNINNSFITKKIVKTN